MDYPPAVGMSRPEVAREARRHADLRRLFEPQSIAVVGVSDRPGSFGARTWSNLQAFQGRLYAVNPKYTEYAGGPCYAELAMLPETPDCVLLATSRELTEDLVRRCAASGVGGVVIYASGYAETGQTERAEEQERLGRIARQSGLRILGPNCMGFVNCGLRIGMTFGTVPRWQPSPVAPIGLVSQSGAIGIALLQAMERGVSFSHLLTAGNSVDVDVADQIAYLAGSPDCAAIACVFEGVADPVRLIAAGNLARDGGKPVVVFKVARSTEGAAAATSHTAMLAGSDAAYVAAFGQAGMVLVDNFESLLETTACLAKMARLPASANGVAVLSASGGMAIMAVDKAMGHGVELPQPSARTTAILGSHVPDFGSARNPCDMTAQVANNIESLRVCADAMLSDARYGVLLVPHTAATAVGLQRLAILNELAREHRKLVCVVWLSGWLEGPGAAELEAMSHCALFRSMDACMATLASHARADRGLPVHATPRRSDPAARARAEGMLRPVPARALTEGEGLRLLSTYGIQVAADRLCTSADRAVDAAIEIGFPVAMKVVSRDIPHKSDAGGVRLGVADAAGVHEAYADIMAAVSAAAPEAVVDGIVVQRTVPRSLELFLGSRRDPVFGLLILVGLGGIWVELMQDVAVRMAPVDHSAAVAMLKSLRAARLLDGYRGGISADRDVVADCIVRFSEMAWDLQDTILEMDVNPLMCAGTEVVAVDALIRTSDGAGGYVGATSQLNGNRKC